MDRLEILQKREGDELTAPEWNSNVDKINEIVDALNGSSSVQRRVFIQNNMEKNFTAQKGEPCMLDFTFISEERYSYNEPYENTGERGLLRISIKNAEHAEYTQIHSGYINSSVVTRIDVAEFLTSGTNSLMLRVEGEVTEETTPAYTYNITQTTLGLTSPNFRWWTAYLNNITIPFMISGNINKKLFVELTGIDNNYAASYDVSIGTATYVETAYNYQLQHPGREGIFELKAYITNQDETIRTRAIQFQVMCTMPVNLKKLMVVNNVAKQAVNWTENVLFEYALYDGMATTTDALFTVSCENEQVFSSSEDSIPTSARHIFSVPMEIERDSDSGFDITVSAEDKTQGKLMQDLIFPVENSAGYSAIAGAALFLNPKTRSNSQANRKEMVNEVDQENIAAAWTGMNWGNDGWQTDASGTKVLRVLAGSEVTIDYQPFLREAARTGKTIEIDFRTYNVVDGMQPVITMSTPQGGSYIGYNICPEEITMFSQSRRDGTTQHLPIDTEVRLRTALTIMPDAYGNQGFNLCCMYINGKKNRVFNYESNDYFTQAGPIRIGSSYADIDIYGIRIYDSALTSEGIQKNYINWLADNASKDKEKEINDVLDSHGVGIDFANTVDQYNCFVFDQSFPRKADPAGRTGTLEVFFAKDASKNFTVTNVACDGQGTSSMKYYEWNIRFRVDKTDSTTIYADGSKDIKNIRLFDNVPKMQRITAKKNWASSMQDHKSGSVNAFNDLWKELGMTNPPVSEDSKVRVAVYQEPFIGFSKQKNEEGEWIYTCMGEFTMGPDKGDKACFGFDTKKYPGLLAIEGSDNAPFPTLFRVPWTPQRVIYNEEEEAFQYNGANSWDLNAGSEKNIGRWISGYNLVYQCSNRIRPYNGTLAALNADVINYRSTGYDYWIAREGDANRYNVYYYEASEGKFIPSDIGNGTINLITQLVDKGYGLAASNLTGKTIDEQNKLFIDARVKKFGKEIGQYFDVQDAIFHHNFIEFVAGTDNRAKNTYVYNFGREGDLWKWRQDDLDTIFPIDNQGQDKKPYWCESHDSYDNGASIWNGETSNFWNLMELAFPNELAIGMRQMLAAMERLSGMNTGTAYDRVYGFYEKYFLSVKNYFPATLVNADSRRYENAKLAYIAGEYSNDTDPITQSHGDFYSTETAWVKKRILYMMSKYSYGMFSADGTDIITVRAAGDEIKYTLVPSMTLYPAIASGTSITRGARTEAGQPCEIPIDLGGAGDQQNNIQGASYLLSIGQWHDKNVSGTMIIQGRRLQEIILGSKTEKVTLSITGLTIANTPSVKKILLSNIKTLQGTIDLTQCIHLKEVYADGTSLAQIRLPEGGGLEKVVFSAQNAYLMLRNFPVLQRSGVDISLCAKTMTDFYVQDCPMLNPIDMLLEVMEAQDGQAEKQLKRVRAVGFDATYTDNGSYVLDRLAQLANGTYVGLDSEGLAGDEPYPVLDGKLTIHADVYEDSLNIIRERFPKLELILNGDYYIRFKDSEFHRLVVAKWGNGKGLKKQDLMHIESIPYRFAYQNEKIKDLSDFGDYFVSVKTIDSEAFKNCINLHSIGISNIVPGVNLGQRVFENCALTEHGISFEHIAVFEYAAFNGNRFVNLKMQQNNNLADKGKEYPTGIFDNCTLMETFEMSEGYCKGAGLLSCPVLRKVVFPSTTTSLPSSIFQHSSTKKDLICKALMPPTLPNFGFNHNIQAIYVPDGSVSMYKAANTWSTLGNIIYPISQYKD